MVDEPLTLPGLDPIGTGEHGQVFASFGAPGARLATFQEADVAILNPLTGELVEIPLPTPRPKPTTAGR